MKSREYKENKHRELKNDLVVPYKQFTLILLELTSLGFVSKNTKEMRTLLQKLNIDDIMLLINLQKLPFVVHTWFTVKEIKIGQIQNYFLMNEFMKLVML